MSTQDTSPIIAGERAAVLSRLIAAKFPIPNGFVVASDAFHDFWQENELGKQINGILHHIEWTNQKELSQASRQIKKLIMLAPVPETVVHQIFSMYLRMGEGRVMLTPSLHIEHSENSVLQDIGDPQYGYEGEANLIVGIKEVWSQFFDPKPLYYRLKNKKDHTQIPFAVIIQRLPKAHCSGILYTADPTAHQKNICLIKCVWGEGAFTKDLKNADYYWVSKTSGEETKSVKDSQRSEVVFVHGDVDERKLPATKIHKRKLPSSLLVKLARIAKQTGQHLFYPQEVLFSYDGSDLLVLDVRPMSTQIVDQPVAPSKQSLSTNDISVSKPRITQTPAVSTHPYVGLSYPLNFAASLPSVSRASGHLFTRVDHVLSRNHPSMSAKVIHHEMFRILSFLSTHVHAALGILYPLACSVDSVELRQAQLLAVRKMRQTYPHQTMDIVCEGVQNCDHFAKISTELIQAGLPRSSKVHHFVQIEVPAHIWIIEECLHAGIDGIVLDIDILSHHLHAGKQQTESAATVELVQRAVSICKENGIVCIVRSENVPSHAMLDVLEGRGIYEWITSEKIYPVVLSVLR